MAVKGSKVNAMVSEIVELKGHIIDTLTLARVLDGIQSWGGEFEIEEMHVGRTNADESWARIRISAPASDVLDSLLSFIEKEGAQRVDLQDVRLEPCEKAGVLPNGFYCTTNQPTAIRVNAEWIPIERMEMDCGIAYEGGKAFTIPMCRARVGQMIVVGHEGIRVDVPRRAGPSGSFEFMSSAISSEKPKTLMVEEVANRIRDVKSRGRKVLLVGGPAIVHAGAGEAVEEMIRDEWIEVLFAGNAFALHDIEYAFYGTALGVSLEKGTPAPHGHEHHLRAVSSIAEAVRQGVLTKGIMRQCVLKGVPYVLCGSIRDDGPLPEVITDALDAQDAMREQLPDVGLAIMVATTLHSVATGNLLPAEVGVVCVDINPAVCTKLADRGTQQAIGIITDAALFMKELADVLRA